MVSPIQQRSGIWRLNHLILPAGSNLFKRPPSTGRISGSPVNGRWSRRRNLLLLSSPLKGTELTTQSRLVRALLLIGVVASLCFSAGEGLRLTPFPVSVQAGAAAPNARLNVAAPREASLHKYGPIDKPSQAQVQKRGKRQSTDCECPPAQNTRKPSDHRLRAPGLRTSFDFTSTLHISEPAGRAPPSLV